MNLVKALKVTAALQLPDPSPEDSGCEDLKSIRCKDLALKCIYSSQILGLPANLSQALQEHKNAESYSTAHTVEPCLDTNIIVGTDSEPASKLESEEPSGKRR